MVNHAGRRRALNLRCQLELNLNLVWVVTVIMVIATVQDQPFVAVIVASIIQVLSNSDYILTRSLPIAVGVSQTHRGKLFMPNIETINVYMPTLTILH